MIKADAAVIGGTGIGGTLAAWGGEPVTITTEFGTLQANCVERAGMKILAVQRHSSGHKTPPHLVNYRAMAVGLKQAGVKACVSSAAVGSLRTDWGPGTLAVCTDMVDLTFRRITLFEKNVVHTDFTTPFPLSNELTESARQARAGVMPQAVYFGLDGPRYESPAEIRMLQSLGGDVVGMTATSEAIVMREVGVPYGCLAVITNLGCGLAKGELHHGEVVDVMKQMGDTVLDVLMGAINLAVAKDVNVEANT